MTKNNTDFFKTIPTDLPSLTTAQHIQNQAATVGFDWTEILDVLDKVQEELNELKVAIMQSDMTSAKEELGDLLFVASNVGRHLQVDAETILQQACEKFKRRFNAMQLLAANQGKKMSDYDLKELSDFWAIVKERE